MLSLNSLKCCSGGGGCRRDVALDLAPRLAPLRPHAALVQPGVPGVRLLDQQGRDLVLHGDGDPLRLHDSHSIVTELQVTLVSPREPDVEPDVVPLVDVHLLHRSHCLGGGLHDVLLPVLHHVQVAAALGGPNNVLQQAGENSSVIRTGLGDCQRGAGVGGHNLEVLGVLHREAVSVPFDCRVWLPDKLHREGGGLSLPDGDGLEG